ncbi:MAG TPA: S24 family peptidase [Stellaceae bacterium]|nr:S24 family peptidase [Stellaceae bacterium]
MSRAPMIVPSTEWQDMFPGLRWMRVDVDSMEPTIKHGDVVAVDTRETTIDRFGGLYVCNFSGALLIRRVDPRPGAFAVTCDNPLYPHETIVAKADIASLNVIGRVVGYFRRL